MVDTLTLAVVSLLLCVDGRGQMFIEMKICCGLFTVVSTFFVNSYVHIYILM